MSRRSRDILSGLNPQQRAAVTHIDGPLLVLAGAGSGKTRVITRKIGYLIGECGIAAHNIAAVTFTNKAAREMKSRVSELVKGERARGLTVSTFHTLGLRILQVEHKRVGYKRGFSIFDADDSRNLVRDILKAESRDLAGIVDQVQSRISSFKSDLISPDVAIAMAEDEEGMRAARAYAEYERFLRAYNAMDFDDLIARPVHLFEQDREALEVWQNRLRYLLVDECQDTNGAQYRLLRLLAGARAHFTVVGDDDQSVYAWRGARPQNMAQLGQDYPHLKVVKLEQNYRSVGRILRVANHLIANNPHVFDKKLWSEQGEGEPVRIVPCKDAQHEAERVVAEIIHHRLNNRTSYGDYAILYRSNHQSRLFEKLLREHRVPYHLSGGTSFFDRSEVRDLVAYLRLLANPTDDAAFLRVVNVPRREIGATTLEKLGAYAGPRGVSLFDACFELGLAQQLQERAVARLRQFASFISQFSDEAENGDVEPVGLARRLLEEIGYEDWISENARDPKQAERRMENVEELFSWMSNIAKQDGDRTLTDILN
ncbi:MAG: UvrD-helicase domain-containing protein, partial [Gammaproteobacteria bacterium]